MSAALGFTVAEEASELVAPGAADASHIGLCAVEPGEPAIAVEDDARRFMDAACDELNAADLATDRIDISPQQCRRRPETCGRITEPILRRGMVVLFHRIVFRMANQPKHDLFAAGMPDSGPKSDTVIRGALGDIANTPGVR